MSAVVEAPMEGMSLDEGAERWEITATDEYVLAGIKRRQFSKAKSSYCSQRGLFQDHLRKIPNQDS